ncbi:MAG: HupE/UreJ family protein, partial [Acidobacteria bacterium]|nr:HupE/UreJ family protein [Acidobacteriota bacterium]
VLLSLTPVYARVRMLCAALAALAALGWMASRISGQTNFIDRAMQAATNFAPLGVLILALLAVPLYFYHSFKRPTDS